MITGFIGLPGAGKTFGMVYNACKALKDNRRVITNVAITDTIFGSKKVAEFTPNIGDAIKNADNCLILVDEASIVFPNYFWNKLSSDILIRFAQVRKFGLDFFYTSQGWNHTVKRLRDLTNYIVQCKHTRLCFDYIYLDPEYFYRNIPLAFKKEFVIKTQKVWWYQKPKVYKAFNTYDRVQTSELMQPNTFPTIK